MRISQILDKIDEHQLFVPAFQREYVWKRDHAKKLISSLMKGYPTGTMLTWETTKPPELKGKHKYDDRQGLVKLILDGQQRITTLYMIIRGEIPPYYTPGEIKVDTRNLHVNVDTLELQYYKQSLMKNNPLWVNLTDIFQRKRRARDIVRALEENGPQLSRKQDDLIDDNFNTIQEILNRPFLEQEIPVKASIEEAIDIFYIVNASGVNLTGAELALAQISGYWPEARDRLKKKLSMLEKDGFVFKLDFLIYVLLGCLYHLGSDMQKLHTADNNKRIREAWKRLDSHTIDYVMKVMRSQAYIDHTTEINTVYALVPIIVYAFDKGKTPLSQDEINRAIKWFYYSQIRRRYAGQVQQKLDKDLGIIKRSKQPFDDLLGIIQAERELEIKPEEFVGVDVRNALWGLMRWYFKSCNAVCFNEGMSIHRNMGKRYELEWDHVFPRSRLKEIGYGDDKLKYALAQEITNRIVLAQTANRTKSSTTVKDYLGGVKKQFPDALRLQCIPEDECLWECKNYEEFLKERRKLLAAELNDFLQNITESREAAVEVSLEDLIKEGESNELEFKSSLRWSYKEEKVNKKLEEVIIKSLAAFSNGEGGSLLIGIDDDGEVLSLEHDYSSLRGRGTKDEFELHLRNIINREISVSFATDLKITFPNVDDHEICRINIKSGKEPCFVTMSDTHGNKTQKFYVRSGNSSIELPLNEVTTYIQDKFS